MPGQTSKYVTLSMLALWAVAWNPMMVGRYMPDGRLKVFLFAAVALLSLRLATHWGAAAALFYAYIAGVYVWHGTPPHGTVEMIMITATLLLVPELFKHVKIRQFENLTIGAAILNAFFGILNSQGIYPFLPKNNPDLWNQEVIGGLIGHHTMLAPFLCFALCLSFKRFLEGDRVLYGAISLLFLFVIAIAKSSMGYLSLAAAGFVFVLFHAGVRAAAASIVAGVIGGLALQRVYPDFSALSGRAEPWAFAKLLIEERPWFGYGTGSWSVAADLYSRKNNLNYVWSQLHSDWMQGVVEWGFVGMFLFLLAFLVILTCAHMIYLFKDREAVPYVAGVAIFAVNSFANFGMHITPIGQLAAICCYVTFMAVKDREVLWPTK